LPPYSVPCSKQDFTTLTIVHGLHIPNFSLCLTQNCVSPKFQIKNVCSVHMTFIDFSCLKQWLWFSPQSTLQIWNPNYNGCFIEWCSHLETKLFIIIVQNFHNMNYQWD
jgi:hypothetical protein